MAGHHDRLIVDVDVEPGPYVEALGERLLRLVVDELLGLGVEITRTRVELYGHISTW